MSKHRRPGDRRPGLVLAALAVAGVTLLGASSPAMAARGGGGGKASDASLDVVLIESADAVVSHGDRITFHVSQSKTDRPFVGLKCWQGTTGVYNSSIGIFEQYMFDPWLTLDSSYWELGRRRELHGEALLLRPARQPGAVGHDDLHRRSVVDSR